MSRSSFQDGRLSCASCNEEEVEGGRHVGRGSGYWLPVSNDWDEYLEDLATFNSQRKGWS